MNKFNFGQNLKAMRLKKKLTQEQMAFRLNISQRSYSRIESRSVPPNGLRVAEIAKALGALPMELVPDFEALKGQAVHTAKGYQQPGPTSAFLLTPFGKFTYIVIGCIVVDVLYSITRGFYRGSEMSDTSLFIMLFMVAITTVSLLYFWWRRLTRLTR